MNAPTNVPTVTIPPAPPVSFYVACLATALGIIMLVAAVLLLIGGAA